MITTKITVEPHLAQYCYAKYSSDPEGSMPVRFADHLDVYHLVYNKTVMTETDDKLLKQFFGEQKQEIEDNGFSRRVMRNLPGRNHRLVQAWGAACAVVCVILFFTLGGLQATISTLREVFVSMVQQSATTGFDPKSLYIAALVLAFFGARKAWSMA